MIVCKLAAQAAEKKCTNVVRPLTVRVVIKSLRLKASLLLREQQITSALLLFHDKKRDCLQQSIIAHYATYFDKLSQKCSLVQVIKIMSV